MSDKHNEYDDDFDFSYLPRQPLTPEQRIELLELQIAELRMQIGILMNRLPWLMASPNN